MSKFKVRYKVSLLDFITRTVEADTLEEAQNKAQFALENIMERELFTDDKDSLSMDLMHIYQDAHKYTDVSLHEVVSSSLEEDGNE